MATTLSSSALVAHNLGLAAGFGGSLFARTALHPATKVIHDEKERTDIVNAAWQRYSWVNGASLAAVAITWFTGRTRLSGWEVDRTSRGLVIAKDALLGIAAASTVGSMISGAYLSKMAEENRLKLTTGDQPAMGTEPKVAQIQTVTNTLGIVSMVAHAGIIGLTAILNMRAGKSARWSLISKLLP